MRTADAKPQRRCLSDIKAGNESKRQASRQEAEYDANLVQRVKAGDGDAFREITDRYRQKLFAIAYSLLHDRHDAEEIVQDAFIRAHRGIARFRGDCSLATWLYRITLNLARNRYWFFHRRARQSTLSLDCPITEDSAATFADIFPASSPTPARETCTGEFVELITACMERLEPVHREILTMRTILNQSYAEIAQALGIEEGTVKSRIARARGFLLSLMAQSCPEFNEESTPMDWLELNQAGSGQWAQACAG